MKKLFFGIIAAVIVNTGIFTFAGCEKEENKQERITLASATSGTKNDNPYSYIGELHNQGMDYIIQNIDKNAFLDSSLLYSETFRLTQEFIQNMGWHDVNEISYSDLFAYSYEIGDCFTEEQIDRWKHYENQIFSSLSSGNYYEAQNAANEFNHFVETQENEEQKTALYIASSVLYSSFSYWTQEFEKGADSEWFGDLCAINDDGPCYATLTQKQKESIVHADATGAVGGAATEFLTGCTIGTAIFPGAGTLTVGIGSALIGGFIGAMIGSSIEAGIQKGKQIAQYKQRK